MCALMVVKSNKPTNTVDGQNPAPVDKQVIRLFYRVLYIPGGAGFRPSTVWYTRWLTTTDWYHQPIVPPSSLFHPRLPHLQPHFEAATRWPLHYGTMFGRHRQHHLATVPPQWNAGRGST